MARLYYSKLQAVLDADITAVATTVTFTAPLREWGEDNIATIAAPDILAMWVGNELIHVTAYTSGASTATVLRGQEGSTATTHNEGDILRHDATATDWESVGGGSVDDTAYDATTWNGVTTVAPSKNAVRDKIETLAPLASPTFTGLPVAPQWKATGITGANTTPLTISGANASGAPASGGHVKGEIAGDDTGKLWYCTVAGTPGTWVQIGAGGSVSDTAYGVGWDGDTTTAPSKNAVYDKIETLGSGALLDYARAVRSAGNITINGTSWANVDTGLDLVLTAATGDLIEVSPSGRLAPGAGATHTFFDVATIVGGSPVNYFVAGGASDEGAQGWRCQDTTDARITGSIARTLVSGDISGGTVTLRLRTRQDTAGNRLFVAGATNPFVWYAKNLGPA